jgi:isoleucyl-tRNA synthetase
VTVLLDTKVSEELLLEGCAREVVSRVQNLRKDSGLNVTDKIKLIVLCGSDVKKAVQAHQDYILGETLGQSLEFAESPDVSVSAAHKVETDIDGKSMTIGLEKV